MGGGGRVMVVGGWVWVVGVSGWWVGVCGCGGCGWFVGGG